MGAGKIKISCPSPFQLVINFEPFVIKKDRTIGHMFLDPAHNPSFRWADGKEP
jgi:hypothetical protein